MASASFNKFMPNRLNFSSKILSKNTTEIVNTCIEKLYKQMPMAYQNNLQQVKRAVTKSRNRDAAEVCKIQERQRQQCITIKPIVKPKLSIINKHTTVLNDLMVRGRKPNSTTNKNLKNTPSTHREHSSRRFSPSASSFSGNLLHCKNDKFRLTRDYHTLKSFQKPLFKVKDGILHKTAGAHSNAISLLIPARNQHVSSNVDSLPQVLEVSSNIQRDLEIINNLVKNREGIPDKTKVIVFKGQIEPQFSNIFTCVTQVLKPRKEQISTQKQSQQQQNKIFEHSNRLQQLNNVTTVELEQKSRSISSGVSKKYQATQVFNDKTESVKPPNLANKTSIDPVLQRDKENQIKSNLMKSSNSSSDQTQIKLQDVNVKEKPPFFPTEQYNLRKPYKINGKIAPTATYLMAKTTIPLNRINYLQTNLR